MARTPKMTMPFFKSSRTAVPTGVFLGADQAWVYRAQADAQAQSACYPHSCDWSVLFGDIAADFGPSQMELVLSPAFYQLITADKPSVADDEIAQALLWAVKDMVAIAPQNIHLDYFESPLVSQRKLQVVITDKTQLGALVQGADASGMRFAGISVEEMMPTHLLDNDPHARLVISHVPSEDVLLTVVRGGELCMHRRLRGFQELDSLNADSLGLGVADNLSLEVQRSMDFFESQLRQPPVASIELLVQGPQAALVTAIAANFNQPVHGVDCEQVGAKMAQLALMELQRGRL
ncbi:MSHA biogenesis protein MshI [Shewanella sp. YIC-542]|uniref:MSHA biogenesis protein MshI n=1 Tax=Shewanella mytili TaxID=3377111 RepID=UPI00398EF6E6